MKILWHSISEQYYYTCREEQRAHKKIMKNRGFEDSGLSSAVIEEGGVYRTIFCGKYRKFTYRE